MLNSDWMKLAYWKRNLKRISLFNVMVILGRLTEKTLAMKKKLLTQIPLLFNYY